MSRPLPVPRHVARVLLQPAEREEQPVELQQVAGLDAFHLHPPVLSGLAVGGAHLDVMVVHPL
jgi:hypothetical protein